MKKTIILADDHHLVRQGLALLLGRQPGWEVVGEAGDGAEAVRLAKALKPRVAVLDVEMPEMNGIEAAARIREVSPETLIVALSSYGDLHYRKRMLEAGASAYVAKDAAIDDLVEAIEAVLKGEEYISQDTTEQEPAVVRRSAEVDRWELSERELDVLRLLAESWRTREIAEQLGISPKTVETYRGRIMLKLGIKNLAGLVRFAIRAGITSAEH